MVYLSMDLPAASRRRDVPTFYIWPPLSLLPSLPTAPEPLPDPTPQQPHREIC